MREGPLFDPRDFMITGGIAHLCAGGESACLHRHATALSRYLRDKSSGMAGRVAQEAEIARARASIARCWGVDAASIGFVGNVAEAIVDAMAQRGVLAWNGQGRIRFSFHGYNSHRDVDQAIGALSAEWAGDKIE
jgi:selenocysteine lyase/cysteine desulfurase